MKRLAIKFLLFAMVAATLTDASYAAKKIVPGAVWLDDCGQPIPAHGGGLTQVGNTYCWFGEGRQQGLDPTKKYVACYASKDLVHWKFRNLAIQISDPENFG